MAITRALLALGLAGTFLLDGIAGSRAAWVLGNVMAVALGLALMIRGRR